MAIKERLLKQLNIVQDGLCAMPPFVSRDLQAMRNALLQARDLCFQGLSENRFAEYKDTFDGLLLAAEQLTADAPDKDEIVSLCSELLQYMIAQTQKETAFKKEIFFLPYKASMWDSLESVWKAADEDKEHCIAYVMPIPYADLTPEHTVAEWHCERGQFPKDVPTVKWEDFNLEEIHPDVIFIHNPYDGNNYVTSVESRYYSSVLKDQTDKLVYIPYFVLAEPELDGKSEEEIEIIEEGIEHFITTPAVLNAHQVIVQSEAMRRVYVNVLTRKMDITDRAFWEKRILGMGSPKFDKVAMTKKEELDIPDEWLKIIQKPDGSWKKIIFYNTGLSAMLQYNEKMLEKIRQVFKMFQEHQDEIALLWRPHPLLQATLKSMRPELAEEYEDIVTQYKAESWGIYDDSADVDRAIILSDAYYGDGSSVIQLYKKTRKPIMLQMPDLSPKVTPILSLIDIQKYNGCLFFSAWNVNGIFSYNLLDRTIEKLAEFPDYPLFHPDMTAGLFDRVEKIEEKLFFIPYRAEHIFSYDLQNGQLKKYEIGCSLGSDYVTKSYGKAVVNGTDIWLVPSRGTRIIKFSSLDGTVVFYDDWYIKINDKDLKSIKVPSLVPGPLIDNAIWFLVRDTNMVCKFDILHGCVEIFHVGVGPYVRIAYDGEKLWLLAPNSDLCWWNINDNESGILKNVLQIDDNDGWEIIARKNKVYVFMCHSPNYAVVDSASMEIHYIKIPMGKHWIVHTGITLREEIIYILPNIGNAIIVIKDDDYNPEIIPFDEAYKIKSWYQRHIDKQALMLDSYLCDSEFLLNLASPIETQNGEEFSEYSAVGNMIYKCINML